jgi:hypothetical protein
MAAPVGRRGRTRPTRVRLWPGCRSASAGFPGGGTGCWRGARSQTRARSSTTSAPGHADPAWSISPGSPGPAGGSRNASNKPRTKPAWITTRSGPGGPGMPTSPCPCSPSPGLPARKPLPQKGNRRPRPEHDQIHVTGDPPPTRAPHPATSPRTRPRLVLVTLATTTPARSPRRPLPCPRLPTISAVAVLSAVAVFGAYPAARTPHAASRSRDAPHSWAGRPGSRSNASNTPDGKSPESSDHRSPRRPL